MSKDKAIKATCQLISFLDAELELLEEHGGQAKRYAQLSRRLMAAQKRLYKLRSKGTIVMAEIPAWDGEVRIHYGELEAVKSDLAFAKAVQGKQ